MKNFFRAAKICLAATAVVCLAACGTPENAENTAQTGMTPAEYATAALQSLEEANSYKGKNRGSVEEILQERSEILIFF